MKHITKRTLALLMSLMLMVSLFVGVAVPAQAAGNVTYKYSGNYVYNWGTRGTVATFLSPMAEDFYEDNGVTYDQLASYAGSSSTSSVPSSALYKQLQNLMKNAQTYQTSYDATRDLFRYTDCQNNGSPSSISAFYSATAVGPAWDSGKTWNREHVWPNSKGDDAGNGENDIMMLRPETASNNSSRGNKAYGESSSYYDPNGLGQKVRGDAARILLYQYVRWGAMSMWGTSGVIESKAILLKWMEEDPVDTWELGRNDAVEAITGTRNVFVDYPELAFELFESTMPTDWATPSGEAADGNQGNVDQPDIPTPDGPTTEEGVVTEPTTGVAYKLGLNNGSLYYFTGSIVNNYYGSTDTSVDAAVDVILEPATNGYYLSFTKGTKQYINIVVSGTYNNFSISSTPTTVFTFDTTKNALCATVGGEVCYLGNYGTYTSINVLKTSKLKDTDYIVRLYGADGGTTPDTPDTPVEVPTPDTTLTIPAANALGSAMAAGAYTEGKYYVSGTIRNIDNSTYGNMTIVDASGNTFYIYGTYNADGTLTYGEMTDKPVVGDTVTIYGPIGNHNNVPQSKNAWITAHTSSGTSQPTGGVSLSFTDVANRTSLSAAQQVWQQNGITVTNDKASSTTDIADYSNPARFYKNSDVTIAYNGMTRIVINSSVTTGQYAKDYAAPWMDSITDANATATVDGDVVTIVFTQPVDSFKISLTTGQARAFTITVYGEGGNVTPPPVDPDEPGDEPDTPDTPVIPDQPSTSSAVIDFTDIANRESYSTEQQIWKQNGITVTNDKGASTSNVGDYGGSGYPARFYKSSTLTIAYPGITKIEIDVHGLEAKYVTAWTDSLAGLCSSCTQEGDLIVAVLSQATDALTIETMAAQGRAYSFTVYGAGGSTGGDTPDTPDAPDTPVIPDQPSASSAVIDFTDIANRESYSTEQQIWKQNGITVTNDKGASTSNVGDYGGSGYPARFYKSSTLTIAYPGIAKIEIDVHGLEAKYVTAWTDSLAGLCSSCTQEGDLIVAVLNQPTDALTIETMAAQGRAYSFTVYTAGGSTGGDTPDTPDTPDQPVDPDQPDEPESNDPAADSELTIPEANELGLSKAPNTYTEGKYYVTGKVLAVDNSKGYGNMYIGDDAGNQFYVYGTYSADGSLKYGDMAEADRPVVGDTVKVYGIIGTYNGNEAQMKNGWIISFTSGEGPANNDPTPDTELTIPEAIALGQTKLHNIFTEGKYYVTGKITSIVKEDFGNMYIEDEQGNSLYIYGLYSADGSIRYDGMEIKPVVGDTITVYGIIGNYNNASQMKNGWIIEIIPGETPDAPCNHRYDNACDKACNDCGAEREVAGHDYKKVIVTKATTTKDGKYKNVCEICGYTASKQPTIYKASKVSLSKTSYTYNGKVQKPSVTVKDSQGKTISSSNYTVSYPSGCKNAGTYSVKVTFKGNYSGTKTLTYKINPISVSKCKITLSKTSYTYNGKVQKPTVTVKNANGTKLTTSSYTVTYASGRKNVGTYKVTIKMKGNYTGTKTLTFKIIPTKTTLGTLTAAKKALTVKWTKKTTQVTGYQIQYSTSKSFKTYKTKTITSNKTTSTKLTGLSAKKTYYVRIRTYKTVNGVKIYSAWSTVKYKKTK